MFNQTPGWTRRVITRYTARWLNSRYSRAIEDEDDLFMINNYKLLADCNHYNIGIYLQKRGALKAVNIKKMQNKTKSKFVPQKWRSIVVALCL